MARRHPRLVAGFTAGLALCLLAGLPQIRIGTEMFSLLPDDARSVSAYREYQEDFETGFPFLVVVETHEVGGALDPDHQPDLERLHRHLNRRFGKTLGLPDVRVAARLRDSSTMPKDLPPLLEAAIASETAPFVDHDRSRSLFVVRAAFSSTSELRRIEREILASSAEILPESWAVTVSGSSVRRAHLSDQLGRGLLENLGVLLLSVALLIGLSFGSLKLGVACLLPNLLPLAAAFGLMGWAGIPLGVGTYPVAMVIFGIAIDDTIHLLTRVRSLGSRPLRAPTRSGIAIRRETVPVGVTTLAICVGFLTQTCGPVELDRDKAMIFAFSFLIALGADLLLTPVILTRAKSWFG